MYVILQAYEISTSWPATRTSRNNARSDRFYKARTASERSRRRRNDTHSRGLTFFGGRALPLAVGGPGARASGIVVYEPGRTRHFVGDALDAVDELVAHALVPVPVVSVGPRTALGRFRLLCRKTQQYYIQSRVRCTR